MRFGIVILLLASLYLSNALYAQNSCTTAQCHVSLLKAKNVHPATESCDSCHESVSQPHPQKGVKTFKLTQDMAGLCANCHDAFSKKTIHAPAKEECTTCHDPHASELPKLLTQPVAELCVTCHSDVTEHKSVHGPVSAGDCLTCHVPHESDTKALLVNEGDQLCFSCHSDLEGLIKNKKVVHPALEAGCTSCHQPHGSDFPKLLVAQGEKVCAECHSDVLDQLTIAKSVHQPLKAASSCVSCHSPHASDEPKLLPVAQKNLCLNCHKNVLTAGTFLHKPVAEGTCTACHNPHSSTFDRLLVKSFPAAGYVSYSNQTYDLCFSCHNSDLAQYPDTSFATNFRDGERNLHFVHVNKKEKGRSCTFCHDVHASKSPKLIADSVTFGKWKLPVKFVKNEAGGSCSPGCHQPQKYDRNKPAKTAP